MCFSTSAFIDRLVAASGLHGTVVFLQNAFDGVGWVGTGAMLLYYTFEEESSDKFHSFTALCYVASTVVFVMMCSAAAYFWLKLPTEATLAGYGTVGSGGERGDSEDRRRELVDASAETAAL